jgi:hypothetical protein
MGWIMIGGLVLLLLLVTQSATKQATPTSPPEFFNLMELGAFKEAVVVENTRIVGLIDPQAKNLPPKFVPGTRVAAEINQQTNEYYVKKLEERGQKYTIDSGDSILIPLLISWGPFILIAILIYFFLFRSLRNAGGGAGMLGSFGRSRSQRDHRVPQEPQEVPAPRWARPARRSADRRARLRQDAVGPGRRGRGGRAVLLHQRLRLRGDVRRRGRLACSRPFQAGQGIVAVHHFP